MFNFKIKIGSQPAETSVPTQKKSGYCEATSATKVCVIVEGLKQFDARFNCADLTERLHELGECCQKNVNEGLAVDLAKLDAIRCIRTARIALDDFTSELSHYIADRGLEEWAVDSERKAKMKAWCRDHNKWDDYCEIFGSRDEEVLCNLLMTIAFQEKYLLGKVLERLQFDLRKDGTARERQLDWERAIFMYLDSAQTVEQFEDMADEVSQGLRQKVHDIRLRKGW